MATAIEDPRLAIGGNNPPEEAPPTPYEAMKIHIDDLYEEAKNFLDGEPITTQGQADEIDRIKALALEAEKDGDRLRKEEAKPFDDGKKEVQERWNPLVNEKTGLCRKIISTCGEALTPFLRAKQDALDAIAAEERERAAKLAEEAKALHAATRPDDLSGREDAEAALEEAARAQRIADAAATARAQVKGGNRATSLRTVWAATITDQRAALNHYIKTQPGEFVDLIQSLADTEARLGPRTAPGIEFKSEQRV